MRRFLGGAALMALAACDPAGGFDPDFRHINSANLDTSAAARQAIAARPVADARGVISYPNYQV
ncbi:MAG: peptidase M23, partial [Alphaproteobacteria bacterium HGW-Alphaproteobacteria-6]